MSSFHGDFDIEKQPLKSNPGKRASTYGCDFNQSILIPESLHPRLVSRELPFFQSHSTFNIFNREKDSIPLFPTETKYVLSHNWFHVMLRWPFIISLFILVGLWLFLVFIFAHIYVFVSESSDYEECGLGKMGQPISLSSAFAFSLETSTTVGYGLPNNRNNFFEPACRKIQITIMMQMISSMIFNGFLTAFLWCRLARCDSRSAQVMFSNKAVIEKRDGKWLFHVRIYDLDSKLPIVEAHVRFYCVNWDGYENDVKRHQQPQLVQVMRIMKPNDNLGAVIFTSVPFNATHHIDFYSPLAPEHLKEDLNYIQGHGLTLREADQMAGSDSACSCPVCGETFGSFENLQRHIKYNKILEEDDGKPEIGTHRDTNLLKPKLTKKFDITEREIRESLRGKEILVLVEGIEPMLSGTFQALHSYKLDDIIFNSCFTPCITQENGKAVVDLDRFHEVTQIKNRSKNNSTMSTTSEDSSMTSGRRPNSSNSVTSGRRSILFPQKELYTVSRMVDDGRSLLIPQNEIDTNSSVASGIQSILFARNEMADVSWHDSVTK